MKKFDAIIIGSGQAGNPMAFKMAGLKKKVALIEKSQLGGTCVNVGCTPTKTYVASARCIHVTQHAEELGISVPEGIRADLKKIKKRKDDIVQSSRSGISDGISDNAYITLYHGEAQFLTEKSIQVGKETLKADLIFINVGASALIPESFGESGALTNKEMLELEEIPEHLIIVGGSYIGLEFGQMFRRFGSKVTIVEKAEQIISKEDVKVSKTIQKILEKEGIEFILNAECIKGKKASENQVTVQISCDEGPPELNGSHLLLAVGRVPNTDTLQLEKAGIRTDDKGYIIVNDQLETNVPGIFALGDCNGKGAFTHTAYHDFEIVSANLFEGGKRKVSERIPNYCLYIDPPLGRAGIDLKQAKTKQLKVKVGEIEMNKVSRAKEKGETAGFMQVIIDENTNKILGATVLGVGGDEIISSLLNIMYADVPYTTIRDGVFPHPTVSELIPTLLAELKLPKDLKEEF
ncbi:FAD-containing oxidoreductase [Pararhodonellum marinum]|uniref:FAD-containing oxidoreductase n=1 Tax=Pararhodonellum marinum TaxID=2755358 RepID=UPI00188FB6B0|nr:FAD-containing oxidoreductase [Pararhodonellum marinum]